MRASAQACTIRWLSFRRRLPVTAARYRAAQPRAVQSARKDRPHPEDGGDGAEVSLDRGERTIDGGKHLVPLAANELRIDAEQQAHRKEKDAIAGEGQLGVLAQLNNGARFVNHEASR